VWTGFKTRIYILPVTSNRPYRIIVNSPRRCLSIITQRIHCRRESVPSQLLCVASLIMPEATPVSPVATHCVSVRLLNDIIVCVKLTSRRMITYTRCERWDLELYTRARQVKRHCWKVYALVSRRNFIRCWKYTINTLNEWPQWLTCLALKVTCLEGLEPPWDTNPIVYLVDEVTVLCVHTTLQRNWKWVQGSGKQPDQ